MILLSRCKIAVKQQQHSSLDEHDTGESDLAADPRDERFHAIWSDDACNEANATKRKEG
jgi:hypothetical protein